MTEDNDNFSIGDLDALGLSLVSQLCWEMRTLQTSIAAEKKRLDELQEQYNVIEQSRLPDALADLGLTELTLSDGSRLQRVVEYHPAISRANRAAAFKWLRENDLGDVIKTELAVSYSRGEEEVARSRFAALLAAEPGRKITREETVHSTTLKALVRERAQGDEPLPTELFGVYELTRAVLKPAKG